MTVTPVGSYPEEGVDFGISGQSGSTYKTNIDGAILSGKRINNAFSPHELNQPVESFGFADVDVGADSIDPTGSHSLQDKMAVEFSNDSADPPLPLVEGTTYYVLGASSGGGPIQLEASIGGGAINFTTQGTGVNTLTPKPSMFVQIDAGYIWDGSTLIEVALQTLGPITAPSTWPRIDRITVNPTTGIATLTTGTETDASPDVPAIPSGNYPNGQILFATDTTEISNTEITDERALWVSNALTLDSNNKIPTDQDFSTGGSATHKAMGVIDSQYTVVGNVGAGVDDLLSYTLPANTLDADGKVIRITAWGRGNNTDNVSLAFVFGASSRNLISSVASLQWWAQVTMVRTGVGTQHGGIGFMNGNVAALGTGYTGTSEDETGAIVIKFTGENLSDASDDAVTQQGMIVEVLN